ncbi:MULTISPECIES: pyruvate, water dikinase regulatory protein [unclassified Adlercreutzia]|uniref:pyruvate, water dikinase regulatory protein n=1 Tax=unclassified Adlercreutzia TaxID=2636013 RepID=UPI0013EBEF26|nr:MULTISPECIES: pyruvate, water dikinase regulatory protein [unclassified Adlercreutzia]
MENHSPKERAARIPTIHIISDSVGATAQAVARAAAAQFGVMNPKIETLSKVKTCEEISDFLDEHVHYHIDDLGNDEMLVFYTLVNNEVRRGMLAYLEEHPNIVAVDLMTGAVGAIAHMSGLEPASKPGSLRVADPHYFRRIEAIEFTIEHDDGRNPQDLTQADIVLIGVSRSSKTPLSIYLSQQGYKVANIPLDPSTTPPKEIYDVDRTRLFGLMTTAEVLVDIRQRRLGAGKASLVAGRYAELEYVYEDLERARALMRQLGCIIVHTEKRAVEETAQEILRYYERSHPPLTGTID